MFKKWLLIGSISLLSSTYCLADIKVLIETSKGPIELLLNDQKAPKTVANFVNYVKKGFYKDTIFHRVIPGFMIQGGGFTTNMIQKNTDSAILNESNNGLKNKVGTIAMARTAAPNSATSQFFININNNDFLNYKNSTPRGAGYAVFGHVTKGMDVINQISTSPTHRYGQFDDVPQTPIKITNIKIIK